MFPIVKRIFIFFVVNILIVMTIGLILQVTGLGNYISQYLYGDTEGSYYQGLLMLCFVWGMAGSFISLLLSRIMVKMMMGVRVINPKVATGDEAELLKIVYTLATRAGMKTMPEVGIYQSQEVNAFATGPSKNRALVAVSTGLLHRMNHDQVEGVLGHEISHIVNGDMVTMTLVQGVVNSFVLFFSHIITRILDSTLRDQQGRGGLSGFTYYLVFNIVYTLTSFLAFPIVAWVSRMREYRADHGGAQLAGHEKMISALTALKGTGKLLDTSHAEVSTLKISGKETSLMRFFMTHPSLDERIQRLRMGK